MSNSQPIAVQIEVRCGAEIEPVLGDLAALRIAVFREFPYLYEGSADYEQRYLQPYCASEQSTVVIARAGTQVIGAATALPLSAHSDEVGPPLIAAGYAAKDVYYLGESVLLPEYRGQGLGHRFFDEREAAAHRFGFQLTTFCAVVRPDDHPRRPASYVPHDAFWRKRGYTKRPEIVAHFKWLDLGERSETEKAMVFWTPGASSVNVRVAAAQYPIERVTSFAAWQEKQARWVAEAASKNAQLLVFPEYAAVELSATLPEADNADLATQLNALQALWPQVNQTYQELARKHEVWLLGGTLTERVTEHGSPPLFRNRARLFGPLGPQATVGVQDKLQMTRFEREEWGISPGHHSAVFATPFGKLGIAICYDSEFPLIVRRLVDAGAEGVLVPSCTDTLAGYYRVSLSCRARALENQCYVLQAVTVGHAPWSLALDENHGAAGIYGPVDQGFPDDGVLAEGELNAPAWVYAELDLSALQEVRARGQVWNHRDWDLPAHLYGEVSVTTLR